MIEINDLIHQLEKHVQQNISELDLICFRRGKRKKNTNNPPKIIFDAITWESEVFSFTANFHFYVKAFSRKIYNTITIKYEGKLDENLHLVLFNKLKQSTSDSVWLLHYWNKNQASISYVTRQSVASEYLSFMACQTEIEDMKFIRNSQWAKEVK